MKFCSKCKLGKEEVEFWKNASRYDGLASECINCMKKYGKSYRNSMSPSRRLSYQHKFYKSAANRLRRNAMVRASKKGLPFNLTAQDIKIPLNCPALGIKLRDCRAMSGGTADSYSIDRIIPELGYVVGNIAVISKLANAIKSSASPAQIRAVADWLESVYPEDWKWLD